MLKQSIWSVFLVVFGLTIGGIQTLGWWTRQPAPTTQVTHSTGETASSQGEPKQFAHDPKHWRSLVMHQ